MRWIRAVRIIWRDGIVLDVLSAFPCCYYRKYGNSCTSFSSVDSMVHYLFRSCQTGVIHRTLWICESRRGYSSCGMHMAGMDAPIHFIIVIYHHKTSPTFQ